MKNFKPILILLIGLASLSCNTKTTNTNNSSSDSSISRSDSTYESLLTNMPEVIFDKVWNDVNNSKKKLSEAQYDSLRLNNLSFLPAFDDLEYQIGQVLVNEKDVKLLTIKAVASGEVSEYLLGYQNNKITDSLLVAYEDAVEYYSRTSSSIKGNLIESTTINWDYNDQGKETADTMISYYRITPQLKFEEITEFED